MIYFYSSATMGFHGAGYFWHKVFSFPKFPSVSKTITKLPKKGYPYAIIKFPRSTWNHVGLHNSGFYFWLSNNTNSNIILSIAGKDDELQWICNELEYRNVKIGGIELNYSCPNVMSHENKIIPTTKYPLQLKLNYKQDPYNFDLSRINKISLNSVPGFYGGLSGKIAQKYNWPFIEKFNKEGLNIVGCSAISSKDFIRLEELGCKEIALGSIMLINPWAVQKLNKGE